MLTEICAYLNNYFDFDEFHKKYPCLEKEFVISGGELPELSDLLVKGQCFYIYGSVLNDGVYQYTDDLKLKDETFNGLVQSMHTDSGFLELANEIAAWQEKYGGVNSQAMSPFNSESFGGYSYSKSGGGSGSGSSSGTPSWQDVYGKRLQMYKRIRR